MEVDGNDKRTILQWWIINYWCVCCYKHLQHCLMFGRKRRRMEWRTTGRLQPCSQMSHNGFHSVRTPTLSLKCQTMVEVADSNKRNSLRYCSVIYDRKKFYGTGPCPLLFCSLFFVNYFKIYFIIFLHQKIKIENKKGFQTTAFVHMALRILFSLTLNSP